MTQCLPVSDTVRASRLRFFCHIARAQSTEDHRRAVWAAMQKPPLSWKRPLGRPSSTWLRVIADDVKPMNFGVHTAWRKANDRKEWRRVVHGHSNAPVGRRLCLRLADASLPSQTSDDTRKITFSVESLSCGSSKIERGLLAEG